MVATGYPLKPRFAFLTRRLGKDVRFAFMMSLALGGWWSPIDLRLVTDDKGLRLFAAQKIRRQFCHGIAKPHKAGGPILTSVVGQNSPYTQGVSYVRSRV